MAKLAPKKSVPLPLAIREHLEGWHRDDAQDRCDDIEDRVRRLSNTGRDADTIYAALAAGVRVVKATKHRLNINELERGISKDQRRVFNDLNKAVKTLEWWIEINGDSEEVQFGDAVERLRELRSGFEQFPLLLSGGRKMRLSKAGRPNLRKRPEELLRRARVPKEERTALLDSLGV